MKSLIPTGNYTAKIVDVEEPKASIVRDSVYRTCFVLEIQQEQGPRKLWCFYAGYLPTIQMIYANRKLWIGTDVTVQVRIKKHDDRSYNDAFIIWPQENLTCQQPE